jgi:hypothetical protein
VLIEILKLIIGPVTGAALALFVNKLFEIRNKKVKLVFSLQRTSDEPSHNTTKTSPSGYQLFCFNIGQVPCFIHCIEFYYKKDLYFEVYPPPEIVSSAILPFTSVTLTLNNQEYDNIVYFYKNTKKTKCKIIADGIDNKTYRGEIDFWWLEKQDFSME